MMDSATLRLTTPAYFEQYAETTDPMELIKGEVVTMPAPTDAHQAIAGSIYFLFKAVAQQHALGYARLAPNDVILSEDSVVQPDVFFVAKDSANCQKDGERWRGTPDICVEVLSQGSVRRDRVEKYDLYEAAGVREYWIVDPTEQFAEVYVLEDGRYIRFGAFKAGEDFTSPTLPQLTVQVSAFFTEF